MIITVNNFIKKSAISGDPDIVFNKKTGTLKPGSTFWNTFDHVNVSIMDIYE